MNVKIGLFGSNDLKLERLVIGSQLNERINGVLIQHGETFTGANLREISRFDDEQIAQGIEDRKEFIDHLAVEVLRTQSILVYVSYKRHSTFKEPQLTDYLDLFTLYNPSYLFRCTRIGKDDRKCNGGISRRTLLEPRLCYDRPNTCLSSRSGSRRF